MQVPAIKKLVENQELEALQEAEEAIMEEQEPAIEVEGEDLGEKLTHVLAAIWVRKEMDANGTPFGKAMRAYTEKVRQSIS